MYVLTSEQPVSLAQALMQAGVRHGDTTQVTLVAGTFAQDGGNRGVHLAFCPSVIRVEQILDCGDAYERSQPISGRVEFDCAERIARYLHGFNGFVSLKARVHTNGHMHFWVPSGGILRHRATTQSYNHRRSSLGKEYALQILQTV